MHAKSNIGRALLSSAAVIVLLCACDLGSSTTELLPTATPAITIVPAPTHIPPDAIPTAAASLLNGDFDSARTQYTAALATSVLKCAALYGLSVTNLRAGQAADAETALTQVLTMCPPTFRAYAQRAEARRVLAQQADAPANKKTDALSDYQQALALAPGMLDSYLYERMAMLDGTVLYLQKAADAPRYLAGQFALRNQLANAYLAANDPADALKQDDAILTSATIASYRAEIEVAAANAQLKIGQTALAYARFNKVLSDAPDSAAAFNAMVALVNANQPVDILLRTRLNVANNNFKPVLSYLPDYLNTAPAATPATAVKPSAELYVLYGQAQRGAGDNASALATFQKVRDSYPTDPLASAAALEQGRTQFAAKNYPAAIAAYTAVASAYPQSADAPEGLWRAGYLEETYGDPARAVALYDQLSTRYPTTDRAAQGAFSAGWLLSTSNPARAAILFGRVGDARGLLWQGKMLQKAGDTKGARQAWTAAAAKAPGSFFSLRAADLLSGAIPYQAAGFRLITSTDAERIAAETWATKTFGQPIGTTLSPALASDPMLKRGTELWALGWWLDARAEFDALHDAHRDDPAALYQLAVYYQGIGVYRSSILAATRVIVLSKQVATAVPPYLARLAYPIDYSNLLVAAARTYGVDPLYFCSLIRLESDFDTQAVSGSEARGLTQIVPSTADDIVGRLNWPPNFTNSDLYRPFISLKLGAYYIDFVRRYLGGNLAATLAGYNAGPGAASGWLSSAGDDLDRLYETISSGQAQNYVQFTYENNAVYRALYGGK